MAGWSHRAWAVVAALLWFSVVPIAHAEVVRDEARPQWVREFYGKEIGVVPETVSAIAVGGEGSVWVVTAGGKLIRGGAGKWTEVETTGKVAAVSSISASRPEVWVGGADGVGVAGAGVETGSPKNVGVLSGGADGEPLAVVNDGESRGVWGREGGWKKLFDIDPTVGRIRQVCRLASGATLALTDKGAYRVMAGQEWTKINAASGGLLSDSVASIEPLGSDHALLLTSRGISLTDGAKGWLSITGRDGLPIESLTCASVSGDAVWSGSEQGVVLWQGGRFTYFAGRRWLPDDRVIAIAAAKDGAWVATRGGIAHLYEKSMTLAEKAELYQRLIDGRPRHLTFVTVMHADAAGDFSRGEQEISDNDGLWTAMYVAGECFRYAVTHDDDAKNHARKSMQALLRLESITGIPGFPARAISNIHDPAHQRRSGGQWHPSPVEKDWTWKGDTSSDEIVGHFLAYYLYDKLVADETEKKQIRATCKRVIDHIIDHGYYLVDITGKPTTWGYWSPKSLNDIPNGDRGLNSLEILSHLRVAIELLGEERYRTAYRDLIEKHHYALNTVRLRPANASLANHSDDELAFLSYYPLLMLEKDPALRAVYLASLRRTWEAVRPEACPPWNFIYGACSGQACDAELAVQALHEIPLDLTHWQTFNGRRADLKVDPTTDRFDQRQLLRPLPWTERRLHKWNGNPYDIDGGAPGQEEDPTFWLLPYWMGRYHGFIG